MADPLPEGAVHDSVTVASPGEAAGATGGEGTPAGTTAVLGVEAAELPTAFTATTVNVYAVALTRLVQDAVVPLTTHTPPEGDDATLYPVIATPPLNAGAVQDTVAEAMPALAVTPVGAPGTVRGVTALDGAEGSELPTAFTARTVNV